MPIEPYPTVTSNGKEYWQIPCLVARESDPDNGVYVYFAKPLGGVSGIPGLIKGDRGKHTEFQAGPQDFTPLAWDDPTAASLSVVEITPGSDTVSQVVQISAALHEGQPGEDGNTVLDPDDFDDGVAGQVITLNDAADGFELQTPWVGGMHWPATITEASAQSAGVTLSTITVASNTYLSDWRPRINAGTVITGSTNDVIVDLVIRLNAADGPIIGRGYGINGTSDKIIVISGPDAGAAATINKVTAGAAATIYLRAEKQSGTATYSTGRTRFSIEAIRA